MIEKWRRVNENRDKIAICNSKNMRNFSFANDFSFFLCVNIKIQKKKKKIVLWPVKFRPAPPLPKLCHWSKFSVTSTLGPVLFKITKFLIFVGGRWFIFVSCITQISLPRYWHRIFDTYYGGYVRDALF